MCIFIYICIDIYIIHRYTIICEYVQHAVCISAHKHNVNLHNKMCISNHMCINKCIYIYINIYVYYINMYREKTYYI